MSISELIKKQAAAVKNGSNANKVADLLEEAAKLLRNEATKPISLGFNAVANAVAKAKETRLDGFAAAMKKGKGDDVKAKLNNAGFVLVHQNLKDGIDTYGSKAKPGVKIIVNGNSFSVKNGTTTVIEKTESAFIETYLLKK